MKKAHGKPYAWAGMSQDARSAIGSAGFDYSRECEQRVVDLVLKHPLPAGVEGIRIATTEEDRGLGIDLWVLCETVSVGVDVKRSFHRAMLERRHTDKIILHVDDDVSDGAILGQLWRSLLPAARRDG